MTDVRIPWVWLVCVVVVALGRACSADAQARPTMAETLAALAVHEGGDQHTDEPAAILAVWRTVAAARHLSLHAAAVACSPRWFRGVTRRPWTLDLRADGHRPHGLGASWTLPRGAFPSRRDSWLAMLAAATAAIDAPSVCDARMWGNADDWQRRRAGGGCYVVVDCGDTANIYGRRCE